MVKNEYRSLSRKKEMPFDFAGYESLTISLDFAKHVEIRMDISAALQTLKVIDQQIIALRFFGDCTLSETAKIVGMRESAVKNRLYRSLEKLKIELKDWGDLAIMSIQDMVSIVDKHETQDGTAHVKKVHQDVFQTLKDHVERITNKYNHQPSKKIIIEIYPDQPTFHNAVGEEDAPPWFMGTFEGNVLKIVSPLDPGPEHTYQSILNGTIHLFTMWLVSDINPLAPKYLRQGIGGYEAKGMSEAFIKSSTLDVLQDLTIPTFQELDNDTWDFETMKGFQFSYLIVAFILDKYSLDALNRLIRNPAGFQEIFDCTEAELHDQWVSYLKASN